MHNRTASDADCWLTTSLPLNTPRGSPAPRGEGFGIEAHIYRPHRSRQTNWG